MLNAFLFLGVMVMAHPAAPISVQKSPLTVAMACAPAAGADADKICAAPCAPSATAACVAAAGQRRRFFQGKIVAAAARKAIILRAVVGA